MTSGAAPIEIFRHPEAYGVARLSQPVDQESLNALRADLSCTREEAMRWVPAEFEKQAIAAYEELSSPQLLPTRGWNIFGNMIRILERNGIQS
jgi:hypothetical protein